MIVDLKYVALVAIMAKSTVASYYQYESFPRYVPNFPEVVDEYVDNQIAYEEISPMEYSATSKDSRTSFQSAHDIVPEYYDSEGDNASEISTQITDVGAEPIVRASTQESREQVAGLMTGPNSIPERFPNMYAPTVAVLSDIVSADREVAATRPQSSTRTIKVIKNVLNMLFTVPYRLIPTTYGLEHVEEEVDHDSETAHNTDNEEAEDSEIERAQEEAEDEEFYTAPSSAKTEYKIDWERLLHYDLDSDDPDMVYESFGPFDEETGVPMLSYAEEPKTSSKLFAREAPFRPRNYMQELRRNPQVVQPDILNMMLMQLNAAGAIADEMAEDLDNYLEEARRYAHSVPIAPPSSPALGYRRVYTPVPPLESPIVTTIRNFKAIEARNAIKIILAFFAIYLIDAHINGARGEMNLVLDMVLAVAAQHCANILQEEVQTVASRFNSVFEEVSIALYENL